MLINSLSGGGAEKVVSILASHSPDKFGIITIWPDKNLDLSGSVTHISLLGKKRFLPLDLFISIFKLISFVRSNNIELVNSHLFWSNYINVISSFFTRHKTFCTHCVSFLTKYKKKSISYLIHYSFCRYILTHSDGHTFKCKDLMTSYERLFRFKNCKVIYNPVGSNKSELEVDDFNATDGINYILCVGRFHSTKNQREVINSLRYLDENVHIIFLGDGYTYNSCVELSIALNVSDRTHFIGHCKNPFYFYKKFPYIVSASISEGFPNVMLEALSCGCYPISYDCDTGPREISSGFYNFDSYTSDGLDIYPLGIIFNSSNAKVIAGAIDFALKNNLSSDIEKSLLLLNALDINSILEQYYNLS